MSKAKRRAIRPKSTNLAIIVLAVFSLLQPCHSQSPFQLAKITTGDAALTGDSNPHFSSYDAIEDTQWGNLVVKAAKGTNGLKIVSMTRKIIAQATIGPLMLDPSFRSLAVWKKSKILVNEEANPSVPACRVAFFSMQILAATITLSTIFDTTYPTSDGNSIGSVTALLVSVHTNYIYGAKFSAGNFGPDMRRFVKLDAVTQQIIPTGLAFPGTMNYNHNFMNWLQDGVIVLSTNNLSMPGTCGKYTVFLEATDTYFEVCHTSPHLLRQFILVDNINPLTV